MKSEQAGRAENANPLGSWASALRPRGIRARPVYGYGYGNATNTTVARTSTVAPTVIVTYAHDGSTSVVELPPGVTDCPAEPWRSTTTVEVTVYITEGSDLEPSSAEPLPPPPTDKIKTLTLTPDPQPPYGNDSSTTPCPEDEQTTPVYPPGADLTTETAYTKPYPTESSDCDNSTVPIETVIKSYEYPPPPAETSAFEEPSSETPRFPVPVTSSHFWNTTTAGVYEEAPTPPVEGSNEYQEYAAYRPAVVAPEDCIIDTEIVPVSTATLTVLPSDKTETPTKTVSEDDAPTGKPEEHSAHCGVHGEPVGNYFLAQFVENTPGEPVTLEGCYQFCDVSLRPLTPLDTTCARKAQKR